MSFSSIGILLYFRDGLCNSSCNQQRDNEKSVAVGALEVSWHTNSSTAFRPPSELVTVYAKARALFELTRLHWFPVGCDYFFSPYIWGFLSAAYREGLPMNEVAKDTLFYVLLGSVAHSAGCVINDMLDRDFDRKVERTKNRPLASGVVTMAEASVLLAIINAIMLYMFWTGGAAAFTIGALWIPTCCWTYPLMKRWIYWPSLFLGFAASWGAPFAWVATTGQFDWGMILNVGIASTCWACLYDTIYACQDKKDDEKAGVKSMAVYLGEGIRPALSVFGVIFFASLLWAGYLNDQRLPYYAISVIAPSLLCLWHIWTFDHNDPKDCWRTFSAGRHCAVMICTGLIVDHYFKLASLAG